MRNKHPLTHRGLFTTATEAAMCLQRHTKFIRVFAFPLLLVHFSHIFLLTFVLENLLDVANVDVAVVQLFYLQAIRSHDLCFMTLQRKVFSASVFCYSFAVVCKSTNNNKVRRGGS